MTVRLNSIGAITLFVEDPAQSKLWYQKVFELPVVHEDDNAAVIKFDNTLINLLRISEAHALIAPAVVDTGHVGSHLQLTVWVEDANAVCAALIKRGVVLLNGPIDREWGMRTACFADPDGHVWEIAQALSV